VSGVRLTLVALDYRPATGTIPTDPGVYRFRDPDGRVIYVGKAKSLRSRLTSYFADPATLHPRTYQMVHTATSVDWVTVSTEVEALQLEYSWIKEFDPRFNVKYRDDKSYPYLAVTVGEEFPRLQVMRGAKRKGVRYFGPYSHAWAIRETLDLLLRVFPARTCNTTTFNRARRTGRPCLLGDIGKCAAPCVGRVTPEEHRGIVDEFCDFMAGRGEQLIKRLEGEMTAAAEDLDFERAARLRDDLVALRRALEKQVVVLPDGTDADVVAFADDPLEAAVQVFHVRGGRVRGQRGYVVEKAVEMSVGELVHDFCSQVYGEAREAADVPRELLVPELPPDVEALTAWLSQLRGAKVSIRIPQRGDKRALAETVHRNAEQALVQHKMRRVGDLTARSRSLEDLAEALDLPTAPLRIECYDISHIQGTDVVGSMVVFEDGLPRKSEYRRFIVKGEQVDDTAAMSEVLRRRFMHGKTPEPPEPVDPTQPVEGEEPPGRKRRFAYPPQLLVVDGGLPQVNAAAAALAEAGAGDVPVIGLAKRLEEVWLPDEEFPVILPRRSEGLFLLQRLRDEAHRFAITHHRKRRSTRMTASALDEIPGLGEIRRKALLRQFGSLKRLRAASVDEIASVQGIGASTAAAVHRALNPEGEATGVGTGESTAVTAGDAPTAPDGTAGE